VLLLKQIREKMLQQHFDSFDFALEWTYHSANPDQPC